MAANYDQFSKCRNNALSDNLKKMWNKKKYSDTVFHVNESQFHASSHFVSASCKVLEAVLDEHFENCGDREIKIGPVQDIESFSIILQFIYGFNINFHDLNPVVLCEVLDLADKYKLSSLSHGLQMFLSKLEQFDILSVVCLMNSDKKFRWDENEKLKIFAFAHVDELLAHVTFSDLQYDIVLDLISSEFCFTHEMNILTGILTWHSKNIVDLEEMENKSPSSCENNKTTKCLKLFNALQVETEPDTSSNDATVVKSPSSGELNTEAVKTFSDNILISLLRYIRFELISSSQFIKFQKTGQYLKYKEFFDDLQYASPICEPRRKYNEKPFDFSCKFNVPGAFSSLNESTEDCVINGIKLNLCTSTELQNADENERSYIKNDIFFKCSFDNFDHTTKINCQILKVSKIPSILPNICSPGIDSFLTVTLSPKCPRVPLCSLYYPTSWTGNHSHYEVHFKSYDKNDNPKFKNEQIKCYDENLV